MNAVFFNEHGGSEVLQYGEVPTPAPQAGEVQVQLRVAALNRLDLWVREGWPGLNLEYPHISGADGAGVVSAIGDGVSGFEIGDRVVINGNLSCGECPNCQRGFQNMCLEWHLLGETVRGTLAEYAVVPAGNLLHVPDDFDLEAAAAAGLVFLTAWHSLMTRGNLQNGERVLIVGASGGANTASIQIAKYAGAEVIVVGSSRAKLDLAESLGADITIDRSKEENWAKAAYVASNREGMDVVVDNVGAGSMPLSLRALRRGGRVLTVGNTGGPKFEIDNRFIFGKHLSIIGSTMGTNEDFTTVMDLVFKGIVKPAIDRTYALEETPQAEDRLEAGEQIGKIIIAIAS